MTYDPKNYSKISLFGMEMNPKRGLEIGTTSIMYYGMIIALGLLLAVVYGLKRRKQFGLKEDDLLDGVLCIVPFAIICARLYYVAFEWASYKDDLVSILYIWKGGLAIYGGIIGAALGVIVFCRVKKVSLGSVLDLVALGFLIGQAVGRWGNFFNREAFGAPTEIFCKMGLYNIRTEAYQYFHPTFLYESLWNFVGFLILHFLSKKRQYDGQIAIGYVAWYGLGRTMIEGLRVDSLYWGNLRVSQVLAAGTCFIAVAILLIQAMRKHDRANLFVNVLAARQAQEGIAAEESEEETEEETEETAGETTEEVEETTEETAKSEASEESEEESEASEESEESEEEETKDEN